MQFKVLRQKSTEPSGYSENTPGELEYELKAKTGSKTPTEGAYECAGGCLSVFGGCLLYGTEVEFDIEWLVMIVCSCSVINPILSHPIHTTH